jgi:hypothetical protein
MGRGMVMCRPKNILTSLAKKTKTWLQKSTSGAQEVYSLNEMGALGRSSRPSDPRRVRVGRSQNTRREANATMKWGALVWRMCWLDKASIRQGHTQVMGHVCLKERAQVMGCLVRRDMSARSARGFNVCNQVNKHISSLSALVHKGPRPPKRTPQFKL